MSHIYEVRQQHTFTDFPYGNVISPLISHSIGCGDLDGCDILKKNVVLVCIDDRIVLTGSGKQYTYTYV